ncbi:MAG: hypothetical protein MO853_14125 [Candidatus Protistobacter heckmanni]|nr:hypothetical protein [Candidatus Protistobacter heckmanni]MCS6764858.1 hypothetical protein [Candidatus Protistobacter heckmanni]
MPSIDILAVGAARSRMPADSLPRDAWWRRFGDAELDALEQRLAQNSPNLAAALARFQ